MKKVILTIAIFASFNSYGQNISISYLSDNMNKKTLPKKVRYSEYYSNKYTFILTSDYEKLISGFFISYKLKKNFSLIYMRQNGRMIKNFDDDVRNEEQRDYKVNAIGGSFDINFEEDERKKTNWMRFYGVMGCISAVPESNVVKNRKTYLYSNWGFVWDAPYVSFSLGMSFAPSQPTVGLGINIGSLKKHI
jgi:hypothetical protein